MARGLGIIRRHGSGMDLGLKQARYVISSSKAGVKKSISKLVKMSKAWVAMSSVASLPQTYLEWASVVNKCAKVLSKHKAPRLSLTKAVWPLPDNKSNYREQVAPNPPGFSHRSFCWSDLNYRCSNQTWCGGGDTCKESRYLTFWTLRVHFYTMVHTSRKKQLPSGDIGVRALGNMNPDQKGWIERYFRHTKTVSVLQNMFGKKVPIELLSCVCCLYSDAAFDNFDTKWMERYKHYLSAVKNMHTKLFGFEAHPLVILVATERMLEGAPYHFNDDLVVCDTT